MAGNWNRNGSNYQGNQGYQRNQNQGFGKPKSGASAGTDKNGNLYANGWRVSKRQGLISYFAAPYKDTQEIESKSGRKWQNWILKVTIKETGQEFVKPCLYDPQNKRVMCQDLNIMISPNTRRQAGGKGYTGRYL